MMRTSLLLLVPTLLSLFSDTTELPAANERSSKESSGPSTSRLLDSLLRTSPRLAPVVARAADYELQIIYTQINRDAQQRPHFVQHNFRLDARQYFNPASLVKLPVAVLALEKLNKLDQPCLTRRSPMATGAAFRCQTAVPYVASPDSDRINTVGNYIKRMLLVSDNQAYNRLYEFLGQRPLNERLAELGYPSARIVRRFAPCDTGANRYTNPITFYNPATKQICYQQPAAVNPIPFSYPLGQVRKGRAYQSGGHLVQRPYDFTTANYLPLQHSTDILKALLFPAAVPVQQRFNLTANDYAFLRYYLHHTPHSSSFSAFASAKYFDAYKKYLYYGRRKSPERSTLRIYNVVGMSHGYLSDVAYFSDAAHHTEFLLSAVLYVNQDGIINDGVYEYETIGLPFLESLGQLISEYEAQRPHTVAPTLTDFLIPENIK